MICYYDLNQQLQELQQILPSIAKIIDRLDLETRQHCERLAIAAYRFGKFLGLTESDRQQLVWGAYLHDIGKIGIPERILFKPEPLSDRERQVIQEHSALGAAICPLPASMHEVAAIVRHHHELWNGTGYPDRLAGEEIPYLVRIVQILDVYDALIHDRCYKRAYSPIEAVAILLFETTKGYYQPELISQFITFIEVEDNFGERSGKLDFMLHTNINHRDIYEMGYPANLPVNLLEAIDYQIIQDWKHLLRA
jgi:putative two-component system response regulator